MAVWIVLLLPVLLHCNAEISHSENGPHLVERGVGDPNCYHKCPGGDRKCSFSATIGFHCICSQGWTGRYCNVPDCSFSGYCVNGGTCSLSNGGFSYTCNCVDGWTGSNCEIRDCSYNGYCANNGSCSLSNDGSRYTCNCADGWTGSNCEIRGVDGIERLPYETE
ncbi:protein jagged-1-like [Mya arenaria]|uniref:protein jagged-1-like n=1 Tax=Mya arenaria TaxID=6604 RepID=UPI0022E492BE|nr:protein jagged-1-like [Mya arenaria]